MRHLLFRLTALSIAFLAGCGSSAPATPDAGNAIRTRCEAVAARQNADPECNPIADPTGLCNAYVVAGASCATQLEAFLSCAEGASDLCPAGGGQSPCATEESALATCFFTIDAGSPDAGR